MKYLVMNIFLAFIWLTLTQKFRLDEFAFGYLAGYLVIWFTHRNTPRKPKYVTIIPKAFSFGLLFVREVLKGSLRVGIDILRPHPRISPGIIAIPLDARTDFEIATLASFITLTPGTTSLAVSDDRTVLYVYSVYLSGNEQDTINEIKNGLEKKLLEVLR
ncbi:MAG TPA: Na+/H+ antiporter subunit E [Bacteroidales bacterium]|nr:Na+/H+ antiporter subunit E [Bacteroidales bacterium]